MILITIRANTEETILSSDIEQSTTFMVEDKRVDDRALGKVQKLSVHEVTRYHVTSPSPSLRT